MGPRVVKAVAGLLCEFYSGHTPAEILAEFERQCGGQKWQVSYTRMEELQQLAAVFGMVKSDYVEPVDEKKLITDAISGMVAGLALAPLIAGAMKKAFMALEAKDCESPEYWGGMEAMAGAVGGSADVAKKALADLKVAAVVSKSRVV